MRKKPSKFLISRPLTAFSHFWCKNLLFLVKPYKNNQKLSPPHIYSGDFLPATLHIAPSSSGAKRRLLALLLLVFLPLSLYGQDIRKFALVIGNSNYIDLTPLANPVNDADDISVALSSLGFSVETVLNGSLDQMEDAVLRLKERLGDSGDAYGFFFHAGHGVQSAGENFLIPVDANIPSESFLRTRSLSVQAVLDELNDAKNSLNVVILDACRDNPFGWSRNTNRGLAMITRQPADSIIVYATSAGQRASDGQGRNGLFTGQLLNNLTTPGLEVAEIFRRTGADVSRVSGNQQIPAVYSQFFGTAYFGERPAGIEAAPRPASPEPMPLPVRARESPASKNNRLWSAGASIGTGLADPWLILTVRGTIAPFNYSFLELGVDVGFVSEVKDSTAYYSLIPFVHYYYYLPFARFASWYAGAGGSFIAAKYKFPEGDVPLNTFAAEFTTGFNFIDMITISYTLRTDFKKISNKVSAGYFYRFR